MPDVVTIDMTPTDEGYANIAMQFADSILSDCKSARRSADANLMTSLVDIVAFLAAKDSPHVKKVREYVKAQEVPPALRPRPCQHGVTPWERCFACREAQYGA